MESTTTNQTPSLSATVDDANGDGIYSGEFTKLPPDSPHGSEDEDSVDFSHEHESSLVPIGFELHEAIDTQTSSRSVDKNQSPETEDVVRTKDSQTERERLDDDVEIVIKNQDEYYFYCPCCGEDITKTVKLVKKSDLQPAKDPDTAKEAIDTKNGSKSQDKKTKVSSWFPVQLQQLFLSVYDHIKDKDSGKIEVDSKPTINDLGTNSEAPSIDVKVEKDRQSFPKWYLDVFAWWFLCVVIALSFLFTSPQKSPALAFVPLQLDLPSISSLSLPSASILWLLPAFAVLFLVIIAMRFRYSPIYHKEKGDKEADSKSTDTTSEENVKKSQYEDDKPAYSDQDSDKKTDNQKVHPVPVDPPPQEQQSMQIANKETHENAEKETPAKTQAEPGLKPDTQPEIPKSVETRKDGNKLEVLKSIVYGGLTQSITSLCTVTSAAASGASTLNVLALGVANLSSGLLLIVHSLQELISEKPRTQTNTDDLKEEEEDKYVEVLGSREKWWFHRLIAISSFVVCGLIPPLVYGFSFRKRVEKRQEYKTLAVYAVSLLCIVLLSVAKAYVSKRREYAKTLFRYTSMATMASGFSTFLGYFVNQWLEKSGFYDESTETPRV